MIRAIRSICEYEKTPLGIDTSSPKFSWQLESESRGERQSAFRLLVASSLDLITQDIGDKWDTEKRESPGTVNIAYAGNELTSGEICFWKVRSWDSLGNPGEWAEPSTFEMGLLNESDWEGSWIAGDIEASSPLFREEFDIQFEVERARLYICGLGWHEAYLNGSKVGDHEFDPAPTWYDNIYSFEIGSRVLYVTHDVTDMLRVGKNAIGAMLGHGWYSSDTPNPPGRIPIAKRPILLVQLNIELKNGSSRSIVTGKHWRTHAGPIVANDMFSGEAYDSRLEPGGWQSPGFDSNWGNSELAERPSGKLLSQSVEPERITHRFEAIRKLQSGDDSWIFDFGQYMSGWAELKAEAHRGTKISIRYAGRVIYETTSLDVRNSDYVGANHPDMALGGDIEDSYITNGDGIEFWHPSFTIHGFRYAEVSGYPGEPPLDAVVGCAVNSDIATTGEFSCSTDLLNRIHHNVYWTFRGSFQGIPQDAAERAERCGWLGDPGFVAEDYLYNFRDIRFWSKWLHDIADTQREDGSVSYIAPPNWGEQTFALWPCWECAYTLFVWHCYNFYDDRPLLEDHYDGVRKQVEYFRKHADDFILDDRLGDHMEPSHSVFSNPRPVDTPADVCGTAYFYHCAWILSRMAEITGREDDTREFAALADSIKHAFIDRFFDSSSFQIATGSQTSNALALYFGLIPDGYGEKILENLVADIVEERKGRLKTGIIGTDALEQALPKYGRADVMYALAVQTSFPSWGFGVVNGQTTIAEDFGISSHFSVSMKMFGSIEKFFYKDVAGISPASPGFGTILVHPKLVGVLTSARASVDSIRGVVSVDWLLQQEGLTMKVEVPTGADAEVCVPALGRPDLVISEGRTTIWDKETYVPGVPGFEQGRRTNDETVSFFVGSGRYEFRVHEGRSMEEHTS